MYLKKSKGDNIWENNFILCQRIRRRRILSLTGFSAVEFIITLTVIAILVGSISGFLYKASIDVREVVLKSQLISIRSSVRLFKAVKGKYPKTLEELVSTEYQLKTSDSLIFEERFLEEKELIDPFDNRFFYNPQTGMVSSQTKGYEEW